MAFLELSIVNQAIAYFSTLSDRIIYNLGVQNRSSLILVVAPNEFNLKPCNRGYANQKIQFRDRENDRDKQEVNAVHVTLSDVK